MAAHRFLLCHILPLFSLVAVQALQYGQKGSETTLAPRIPGPPDKILWKQAFRRVVEFDGSEESVHGTFRDRVVLDWHTASLTVRDLQEGDSGPYELEATINNKKYYSQHEVAVIDKVAVPTISCLINGSEDSAGDPDSPRALARLKCVAEGPPSLLSYSWTLLSGAHPGQELPVVLDGKQDETVFYCRAANPVSEETGTFVAKDCYPDTFSTTALIISLIVLGLLIVLVAGCFVGYRRWKKAHPEPTYNRDVEEQPLKLPNGPDHGGGYDKDNGATLPSTQRLPLLTQDDLAPRSGGDQDEGETTGSGRWGNATLVREDPTEPKAPEPADLESECSLPPPASPAGRGWQPAAAELDAMQTLESTNTGTHVQAPGEPERRLEAELPGTPPGDGPQILSVSGSPQDAVPLSWSSTSPEDLQSASLETTDHSANCSPSATLPEPTSGAQPDGHLGSDEGSPAAAVPLREENEAVAPPSCHSSSEDVRGEEEEEKEEQRKDTGGECSSTGEDLAADDEPNEKVEALASETEEEEADTRGTHGESDEDRGEAKEDAGRDGPVVSLTAQTPQYSDAAVVESTPDRGEEDEDDKEEEEETSDTPGDKHQTAEDGAGPVASPPETKLEATERREGEEDNHVPGTSHEEDPRVPEEDEVEEDDGRDRVAAVLPASEPEAPRGSEEVTEESPAGHSAEEDTPHAPEDKRDRTADRAGQEALPAEPATETPERTEEEEGDLPQTSHDEAEGEKDYDGEKVAARLPESEPETRRGSGGVAEESLAGHSAEEDASHAPEDKRDRTADGAGQVALPAEPATETPERTEEEEGDLPQTSHDEAEGEKDYDGEKVAARLPESEPETRRGSGGVAEESLAGPSAEEEEALGAQTPVRKDEHEEGHKEDEEEEGGREDEMTRPTQTESSPESRPDPDQEPGETAASQEETQGPRGNDEETKEQTGDGSSPDQQHAEQTERRDGQKEASRDTIPE